MLVHKKSFYYGLHRGLSISQARMEFKVLGGSTHEPLCLGEDVDTQGSYTRLTMDFKIQNLVKLPPTQDVDYFRDVCGLQNKGMNAHWW